MDTSGFFETFFNNARYNGIVIMNKQGIILNINEAFHTRFGYTSEDLTGKNFKILFTEKDQLASKPETELQTVLTQGSANDENYLVHKNGNKVWVTGESVYIENKDGNSFLVKVVHNIHAQKQLERFLIESHEFIDTIFDSVEESALIILDSRLRVIKTNKTFLRLFELGEAPAENSRLADIDNPFWSRPDVKQETLNFLTRHNINETKIFELQTHSGDTKKISFLARLIEGVPGIDRKLLVMIKEIV